MRGINVGHRDRRIRVILLLFLVPIVVVGIWVLRQDVFLNLMTYVISPNKSRLAAITVDYPQDHRTLNIWDIPSGKQIASRDMNCDSFAFTHDGRYLLTAPSEGPIDVLEAETLQGKNKIGSGISQVVIWGTLGNDIVVVSSQYKTVFLIDVLTGKIIKEYPNSWRALVSADGQTFLVGTTGTPEAKGSWKAYRLRDHQIEFLSELPPQIATITSISPSGSKAACYLQWMNRSPTQPGAFAVVDLLSGRINFTIPDIDRALFVNDDQLLTYRRPASVQRIDATHGTAMSDRNLNQDLFFLETTIQNSLSSLDVPPVPGSQPLEIYDWTTGHHIATLPMSKSNFYRWIITVCVLFALWSCLWIATGIVHKNWHPALDVVVVHAVFLAGLIVRFLTTGSQADEERVAAWMLYGQGIALTCLGVLWAMHGPRHWLNGVTIIVVSLSSMIGIAIFVWAGTTETVWQITVGSLSFVSCIVGVQAILRRRGYKISSSVAGTLQGSSRDPADSTKSTSTAASPGTPVSKRQVTLRDLMVFAAGTCLLFSVARFFVPRNFQLWLYLFLILNGVTYATLACVALWAALGQSPWWLRLAALLAVSTTGPALIVAFFHTYWIMPWWWYLAVHLSVACWLLSTLLVFRWRGYRWSRRTCVSAGSGSA